MKRNITRTQRAVARHLAEVAMAVPQILVHRAGVIAAAQPSEDHRRELNLMVSEKAAAFSESWIAMSMQAMRVNLAWSAGFFRSPLAPVTPDQMNADLLSVFGAGLAPVHRVAVANAKRLSR